MQLLSVTYPNYLISVFNSFVARVGKTSLIMSLVSEEFPEEVEHPYLFSLILFLSCCIIFFFSESKLLGSALK